MTDEHIFRHTPLTRRRFLQLTTLSVAGLAAGCAVNPVTGRQQLMLVSQEQEIGIDKENSPHQFSVDYGAIQDQSLNNYIGSVGKKLVGHTHRPDMPYSFRGVNAAYINAYAFPGGSIAATRGILLAMENEAQLAALLGHELAHVNARHTASQMSKGLLGNVFLAGAVAYAGQRQHGQLAEQLGMLSAGLLLASYSRDNEREADAIGMEYMVAAGYNPQGMIGLMAILQNISKHKPGAIELMFSTHPMSDERYTNAQDNAAAYPRSTGGLPVGKERYLDKTAALRKIADAIKALQNGDEAMAKKEYEKAKAQFAQALKQTPGDYAALVMMAKCQLAMENYPEASRYADLARQAYPQEAQSYHLQGIAKVLQKKYDAAYQSFTTCDKLLPGNPNITFYKAISLEGMQRREEAAMEYRRYLQQSNGQGSQAGHAYQRLVDWGYVQPPPKPRR
ncbi:MAG: M48 family metalloprotease [Desulfobulbaceae bacterium]|nr:M48 family metalloprotease [Desulfobulbaceae bacterium]